jgi:hypothetical protein
MAFASITMSPVSKIKHTKLTQVLGHKKKQPVVPVPDRPYFFLPTLLFFQRDWLCDPVFSRWLQAAHTACQNGVCCHTNYWTKLPKFVHRKYASLVNIDVGMSCKSPSKKPPKTMKKLFKKKIYFQPTDPNFFTIKKPEPQVFFYAQWELWLNDRFVWNVTVIIVRQNISK